MIFIWLLLALIPIGIIAVALYLFTPYWQSPQRAWKRRVLAHYARAQDQFQHERARVEHLATERTAATATAQTKAFDRYLASISIDELATFPGIGAGTIARLRQAGFSDLAHLRNTWIHVRGLGEKRLADISAAQQQLMRDADSRFRSGACSEAQGLCTTLQQIEQKYAELETKAKDRSRKAGAIMKQLERPAKIAREVSFWNYLWQDAEVLVPPEFFDCELPDIDVSLEAAEQELPQGKHAGDPSKGTSSKENKPKPAPASKTPREAVPFVLPAASERNSAVPRKPAPPVREPASSGRTDRAMASMKAASRPAPLAQPSVHHTARQVPDVQVIIEATIEFAYCFARLDGLAYPNETTFIRDRMRQSYAYDQTLHNRAQAWCAHYENAAIDVEGCIRRIRDTFTAAHRAKLLDLAGDIADACGGLKPLQRQFLEKAAGQWQVPWNPKPVQVAKLSSPPTQTAQPPTKVARIANPSHPPARPPEATLAPAPPADYRLILEIDSTVKFTPDLVRRQYNLLSAKFAPEKFESFGPTFVAEARNKREAIRLAADKLMADFGQPLELPHQETEPAELRHNPDLDAMFG